MIYKNIKIRNILNITKSSRTLIFLFFIFASYLEIFSQNWIVRNYTEKDGLPTSVIFCLTRDINGIVWVGHNKGISRYDGTKWTHYTEDEGLRGPVLSITILGESVWAGTNNGLFYSKNLNNNLHFFEFEHFRNMCIPQIAKYKDRLFIAAYNYDLRKRENRGILYTIKKEENSYLLDSLVLTQNYYTSGIKSLKIKNDTIVYVSEYCTKAILQNDGKNCKLIMSFKLLDEINPIMDLDFYDDIIYITTNNGLFKIFNNNIEKINNKTCHFVFIKNDKLWVAYPGEGIVVYSLPDMKVERKLTIQNGLANSFMNNSFYLDSDSSLWIPTKCGLTHLLSLNSTTYFDKVTVSSFYDCYGKILVGNENLLSIINNYVINNIHLPHTNRFSNVLLIGKVENRIFFNNGSHLYSFNIKRNEIDLKSLKFWKLKGQTPFRNCSFLNKNEFLIAMGRGLGFYNLKDLNNPIYFFDSSGGYGNLIGNKGLPNNYINCIKITNEGALIGTRSGLAIFDYETKNLLIPNYLLDFKEVVNDIWINGIDTLIATDKGLYKLQNTTLSKVKFNIKNIAFYNIIIKDSLIYCGTSDGVYIINKDFKILRIINDLNWLPHRTINQLYFDKKGNLWIGTPSGCLCLDKNEILPKPIEQIVFIHRIQEGNRIIFDNKLPAIVPYPTKIYLDNSTTTIKLFCSSHFIFTNEDVNYVFSLINNSDTLYFESDKPSFETPILTSGSYEISIRIIARGVTISNQETIIAIVPTPIFLKWYNIILYAILLILIVVIIIYIRTRKIIKRNKILREEVELRTKDIRAKMIEIDELSRARAVFINFFAHDLTNAIANLRRSYELLNKGTNPEQKIGKYSLNTYIKMSLTRISNLIKQVLMLGRIESDRIEINKDWMNINGTISKVIQEMSIQAFEKNIQIKTEFSELQDIFNDKLLLEFVFENIISNALKFSPLNSEILIKSYNSNEKTIIEIIDSGPGFKPEDIPLMFKPFQKLSAKPTKGESSTGLGLWIVKSLLELLGGSIIIKNNETKGATVIIVID